MRDMTHTADTYLSIWNATEEHHRQRLIGEILAGDATYVDPMGKGEGHAGIGALVAAVQGAFPGHRFNRIGGVDGHGPHLRFSWELTSQEGGVVVRGTDYAQTDEAGRLTHITGFIDYLAAQS